MTKSQVTKAVDLLNNFYEQIICVSFQLGYEPSEKNTDWFKLVDTAEKLYAESMYYKTHIKND